MKEFLKVFGIIALAAIIGFTMLGCPSGDGGGGGPDKDPTSATYISYDASGTKYELVITKAPGRAAFVPLAGDTYVLTITPPGSTSTGTVKSVTADGFELEHKDGTTISVTITGGKMEKITGAGGKIPVDSGDPVNNVEDLAPTSPVTSIGNYAGKDVLGNRYSLAVGSGAASSKSFSRAVYPGRAVAEDDRFDMTVKARDGKDRVVSGRVKKVNADKTIILETNEEEEFTAVVDDDGNLNSVAGVGDEMPQISFSGEDIGGSNTLTPRTFDEVYLRATRWENPTDGSSGEHWGSGKSVLLRDYPTNVSTLQKNAPDRYTITISGTSDVALDYIEVEVQGLDENDNWKWLTGFRANGKAVAGTLFTFTGNLYGVGSTVNLLDYQEIILQVTNVMKYTEAGGVNNKDNGSIPADIEDGAIMATISDFKIALKDTSREAFAGNMPDFHYGFQEDGMSVDYRQAVWELSSANITEAKKAGAKFEFVTTGTDVAEKSAVLGFAWQDPDHNLWWQDSVELGKWSDITQQWEPAEGVEWIPWQNKVRLDLGALINDTHFADASNVNFIIGYWWHNGLLPPNEDKKYAVDELAISGANIIAAPAPCAGSMGSYNWGYAENGITPNLKQAVWHLSVDDLTAAQTAGAKLEIVFSKEQTDTPTLALIWQGISTDRWWPTNAEAGTDNVNLKLIWWDTVNNQVAYKTGVSYDSTAHKLTIVLNQALETYGGFAAAGVTDANFVLDCFWGITTKIDELGIVSASIVTSSSPPPTPPTPNTITGNIGQYQFGFEADGVTPIYTQACWTFEAGNTAALRESNSLDLEFSKDLEMPVSLKLVWQDTVSWSWHETDLSTHNTWYPLTKTLHIDLPDALTDYSDFQAITTGIKLIIESHYTGIDNINDLGMVSAKIQ